MPVYCLRDISAEVRRTLKSMPAVVVTGMRQTGKTTFFRSEPGLSERAYVSLDDFFQLEAAKSDPDGFIRQNNPITVDEAQKCPEIFGVREMSQVGNLMALRALLRLTALRTGQMLSPGQLGRDAKLSAATTSRYLSLFEASFFINRIPPYLGNRASRVIKSPKLNLSDSGLAAYLAGIDLSSDVLVDPLYGPLFETYAAQNLSSILSATWQNAGLHFWAVQGRNEVDFVIESGRACMALEFKSTARWHDRNGRT